MSDEAQPVEGQDQSVVTSPTNSGPWANDLETRFADPEVRQTVDAFLREQVQPYVTRLEQGRNDEAERLYDELQSRPGDTYMAITEELFGAEVSQKVTDLLLTSFGEPDDSTDAPVTPAVPATDEPAAAPLNPRVEAMLKAFEDNESKQAYDAELARLKAKATADNTQPVIDELIAPFIVATNGDFDRAYQGYAKHYDQFRQQFGGAPAATTEVVVDTPPAVLGSDSAQQTTPPVQAKFTSLDDAMDSYFDEQKVSPPAPVGST